MLSASFMIPDTHPGLAGHFPGLPITPGVVTLDYVVRGLLEQLHGETICEIPQVKFLRPLLPNAEVIVTYKIKKDALYQFNCKCEGATILSGQLKLVTPGN